jgi:hypothetical protein
VGLVFAGDDGGEVGRTERPPTKPGPCPRGREGQ